MTATRTITLNDNERMRIVEARWALVGRADDRTEGPPGKCPTLRVRRHADDRVVVYGVHPRLERRAGEVLPAYDHAAVVSALARVAARIGADESLAPACAATLTPDGPFGDAWKGGAS